jgi:hypothetical protein
MYILTHTHMNTHIQGVDDQGDTLALSDRSGSSSCVYYRHMYCKWFTLGAPLNPIQGVDDQGDEYIYIYTHTHMNTYMQGVDDQGDTFALSDRAGDEQKRKGHAQRRKGGQT